MRTRHALDLSDCNLCMTAALREAEERRVSVTIAIVDDGGALLQLTRMDEASPASVEGATEKARTAALIGVETRVLEAAIKDRPGIATMRRVAVEGGLPILHFDQRVGGIGVSGALSQLDAAIARVGLLALVRTWTPTLNTQTEGT